MATSLLTTIGVAAILLGAIAIFGLLLWLSHRRKRCPTCSKQSLKNVQFIRATNLVNGARAPDSWSYLECESCKARFKEHHGELVASSEEEWNTFYAG